MRPQRLLPLFADITSLKGIGPRLEALLRRLLHRTGEGQAPRVIDLLFHLPTGIIDRSARPKVAALEAGQIVTLARIVRG